MFFAFEISFWILFPSPVFFPLLFNKSIFIFFSPLLSLFFSFLSFLSFSLSLFKKLFWFPLDLLHPQTLILRCTFFFLPYFFLSFLALSRRDVGWIHNQCLRDSVSKEKKRKEKTKERDRVQRKLIKKKKKVWNPSMNTLNFSSLSFLFRRSHKKNFDYYTSAPFNWGYLKFLWLCDLRMRGIHTTERGTPRKLCEASFGSEAFTMKPLLASLLVFKHYPSVSVPQVKAHSLDVSGKILSLERTVSHWVHFGASIERRGAHGKFWIEYHKVGIKGNVPVDGDERNRLPGRKGLQEKGPRNGGYPKNMSL